ncbi:MAG: mechanosensitive ion channel family protein [Deltaproteobacteria bacterium]|nr:mechanosensitive ion channel family protein [Kofleriaceae bacterium]
MDEAVATLRSPYVVVTGLVIGAFIASRLALAILRPLIVRAARRSSWEWDDLVIGAVATPVSLLVAVQALRASLPWLPIDARGLGTVSSVIAVLTTALVMWIVFRTIDVVVGVMATRPWAIERPASRSLLSIASRVAKVVIVILAVIVVLAQLGVSVASLIAGLGIGGLAIALAAQKTVENLFGTMSIAVDQPMREGDFVKVGDHLGTVEAIGLRSTRIRTLDRTLVTIANGQLADQRVESYTARDRIRLACELRLRYGTTAAQMREVLEQLEATLRAHPRIWPDTVVVRFKGLGATSLEIEVMAWFQTSDWGEFQLIRQNVLLEFMEIVESRGSGFAFPTQTVHVVNGAKAPAPPRSTHSA